MPRLPVDVKRVTPTGGYGKYRVKARRTHAGVDLGGARGTPVYAPEALTVVVALSDGKYTAGRDFAGVKLTGYDPAAILARGESGVYHVLGHLEPGPFKLVYDEGDQVGTIGTPGHVHWEVRKPDRKPWRLATRLDDTLDPIAWLSGSRTSSSTATPWEVIEAAQSLTDQVRASARKRTGIGTAALLALLAVVVVNSGVKRYYRRNGRWRRLAAGGL